MLILESQKSDQIFKIMKRIFYKLRYITVPILLAVYSALSSASVDNIRFEKVTASNELSQQTIIAMFQDSHGYMWFGTQEGLNRFDGIRYKSYLPKFNDEASLSDGWIYSIDEDTNGNLWVGTNDGVNILNKGSDTFINYTHNLQSNKQALNDKLVRVVHRGLDGTMWVATRKGLNQYIEQDKRFKHHNFLNDSESEAIDIHAIAEDITGALWLGTNKRGLMRFDPITQRLDVIAKDFTGERGSVKIGIRSLYIDDEQVLWIGSNGSGLFKLDLKSPKVDNMDELIFAVEGFEQKNLLAIAEDAHGTLWIGTNTGLYYRQPSTMAFSPVRQQMGGIGDLTTGNIWSLYSDFSGVFWVGTFSGLNKWNTKTTQFDHFFKSNTDEVSLSANNIHFIGSTASEQIYIGSTGGVDLLTSDSNSIYHLPLRTDNGDGLKEKRVMSFAYVNDEEIWFGYRSSGASKYNPKTNTFVHYDADADKDNTLQRSGVTSILKTENGTVWLGTFDGGLSRYNRETDDFTTFLHDPTDISSLSSNKIMSLFESKDNALWLGTWDAGVNVFVPKTESAFRITRRQGKLDSLSANRALSVIQDSKGNIWIGTAGGGISILSAQNKERGDISFTNLNTENGLPSNAIYGLVEDDDGYIWGSTNKGLVKINSESYEMTIYKESSGLQGNEFNSGAYHKASDGYLYFGGTNGVTRFKPEDIKANPIPPKIDFTSFQRLNIVENIGDALNEEGVIQVDYTDYLIAFEFAALDFASPANNQFKYKLNGFDKDWVEVRGNRRAVYTNLPAGEYEFTVIASNSDGVWNEKGKSIGLVVNPAPWFSWWAYSIYIAILCAVLWFIYTHYRRKNEQRAIYQIQLAEEVSARTAELSEANEQLLHASITDQLTGLHNRRYLAEAMAERLESINRTFGQAILDDRMSAYSGPRIMALMFDLDGFKPINDNYGHDAGDQVIIQVAEILQRESRQEDIVIRWGGDEYMVVAEVENLEQAKALVERIRVAISSHAFDVGLSNKFHLSSSLGFALYPFSHFAPHSITWDQVHLLADHALYKSKDAGRNTWSGIVQSDKELAFSVLNSLVPNLDKALEQEDVLLIQRQKP
jgi:diguanylate cyclase (GGDEF)-like protein